MNVREVALTLVLMDHSITLLLLTDIPLNEDVTDKIRDYRTVYDNRPFNSIFPAPLVTSTVNLCSFYFCRPIEKPLSLKQGSE